MFKRKSESDRCTIRLQAKRQRHCVNSETSDEEDEEEEEEEEEEDEDEDVAEGGLGLDDGKYDDEEEVDLDLEEFDLHACLKVGFNPPLWRIQNSFMRRCEA